MTVRGVLLVARNDLLRRLRNRSAVITAVVAPLALAVVFSVLVGGTGGSGDFEIGVVDEDGSPASSSVVDGLVGSRGTPVRFVAVERVATAEDRVDEGTLDAALVLPAGLGASGSATPATIRVLQSPDRQVSGGIAEAVATDIAQRFDRAARAVAATAELGGRPDAETISDAIGVESAVAVEAGRAAGRDLTPAAFFGASMSMLFLFFTVGYASSSTLVERREGTLDRMLSTPTSASTVLAGKALSVGVLGLVGFVVVWAVTSLGFGARWGWWPPVLAVIVATTFAVSGVATFAASLARTEQQTESVTAAVAFTLALLGGNFIGPGQAPELLGRLSRLTPNGWALGIFTDLATDTATPGGVAAALAVLAGFGLVLGAIGLRRIHRVVQR